MTIIYDAKCRFCTAVVLLLNKRKKSSAEFELLDSRDRISRRILLQNGIQFVNLNTIYAVDEHKVLVKSGAVFNILKKTKAPFRFLGIFGCLPVRFTDKLYDFIARNRYRISALFVPDVAHK